MLLSLHSPEQHIGIRSYSDNRIVLVSGTEITSSFWLHGEAGLHTWHVDSIHHLQPQDLDQILAQNPEIILLGTGAEQHFPQTAVMAAAFTRRIGLEIMSNAAAARTFNVLVGEGRNVLLAMLLNPKPQA